MKRGTKRIPQESAKRKAERPTRTTVREDALARSGHRCTAVEIVPEIECWGPLDVDEIKSRGVNPGGHLDDTNVQVLCRAHHTWRTENPAESRARGLRLESWETAPEPLPRLPGLPRGTAALADANTTQEHDARGATFGFMCRAIQMPDGRRYYGAKNMLEDGILIPDKVLAEACEPVHPGEEPFPPEACFCCVDAETILDGIGWAFTIDELGDHVVTGRRT